MLKVFVRACVCVVTARSQGNMDVSGLGCLKDAFAVVGVRKNYWSPPVERSMYSVLTGAGVSQPPSEAASQPANQATPGSPRASQPAPARAAQAASQQPSQPGPASPARPSQPGPNGSASPAWPERPSQPGQPYPASPASPARQPSRGERVASHHLALISS